MELELGLKITRTREDVSSSVDFRFSKDPFGPLVLSRETDSRFIIIIHLKGFKKEGIEIEINKEGNRITISGRKPVEEMVLIRWMAWKKEVELRAFRKVFLIPDIVDLDKIKARFDDDDATLTITMPKRVKGISGFKLEEEEEQEEEEEERVDFGDVSEVEENREEIQNGEEVEKEDVEREKSDEHSENFETEMQREEDFGGTVEDQERESQVLGGEEKGFRGGLDHEEETQIDDDNLEKIQETTNVQDKILEFAEEETVGQQELADSDAESEDSSRLINLPEIEGRDSHEQTRHEEEEENNQEVVEQQLSQEETKSDDIESIAFEEQEPDEIDRTSKSRAMEKKTTDDDDDDGLSKVQGIDEPKRDNEESKIHEMMEGETGGQEKKKIVKMEIRDKGAKEDVDVKLGEGFTPNIERTQVVGGDDIAETETKAEEFESDQQESDELVEKKEEEEENSKVRRQSEDRNLIKALQETEEQHSKGQKQQDKTPEAETYIGNDIPKPVQETEVPEVDLLGEKGNEGKEKKKSVTMDFKNGYPKEEVDAEKGKGFAPNIAETETKSEEFESDQLQADEVDKIHELIKKKEEEEKKAKAGTQSEDISLIKPREIGEEQFQGQKLRDKQEKRNELVEEQTPEAENNIGNDTPKPVQERCEGKHEIPKNFQEETKNPRIMETGKKTNEAGARKVQEIIRQRELEEAARCDKESTTRELVKSNRNDEEKEEKETAETEAKEQDSYIPKMLGEQEKIPELAEEKTNFLKNGKVKEGEEIAEKKTEFGDDDLDAKEEVDAEMGEGLTPKIAETETKDKLGTDEIHELVEKKEEAEENDKVRRQSEDSSLIKKLQETEEQQFQGQKRHNKQENIKGLVEEKTPEGEPNIANEILNPVQEIEEPEVDTLETREEKEIEDTETEEQESYRPKILREREKIQELAEERTNFSRKAEEEEETAERKTDFSDDDMTRKVQDIEQRDSDAMKGQEEKDRIEELVLEKKVSDGGKGTMAVAETIAENDKPRKIQEIDQQHSDDEDKRGNQFQKLIGGEKSGHGEVEDVDNEKKSTEADKRFGDSAKEAQEIERKDSDVSRKGDTIQELQENRTAYQNEQEEADRPEKITGTIEQELVNLNSQLEQDNVEDGEKTQELVEEKIKDFKEKESGTKTNDAARKVQDIKKQVEEKARDCKEEESETKTDDVVRKVQEIKEQELYEPKRDHVSKIKELVAELEIEAERGGLSKVHGSEEQELHEPNIHKERDETQITGPEEPSGQEKEKVVESMTITEKDSSINVQEIREERPHKPESHEKQYKIQEVVEAGYNDRKEEQQEEKIKAKPESEEDSSRKVQEIENQEYDGSKRPTVQDKIQETGEKDKTRAMEDIVERRTKTKDVSLRKFRDDEDPELSKPYKRREEDKIQELVEMKTSDYREKVKKQDGNDILRSQGVGRSELDEFERHSEQRKIPQLVEEEKVENIAELGRKMEDDSSCKFHEFEERKSFEDWTHETREKRKYFVEDEATGPKDKHTGGEGHNDHKEEEEQKEKVIAKAELKSEEDSSKKGQEIEKQRSKMQETKKKDKTRAMEEERRTKKKDGSLGKVRDGKEPESSKLYKRRDEDKIQELVEMETSDYREKVKKRDGDDILRSQEAGKQDLGELDRHCKQRKIHEPLKDDQKGEAKVENISEPGGKMEGDSSGKFHEFQKQKSYQDWRQEESEEIEDLVKEESTDPKDKHTGGKGEHEEERYEKVAQTKTKVENEINKKVGKIKEAESEKQEGCMRLDKLEEVLREGASDHEKEEEALVDDSTTENQEPEKQESHESEIHEKLDIVQDFLEDKTEDQKAEEAAAVVENNEKDSLRKLQTIEEQEREEHTEHNNIPKISDPEAKEENEERVAEKETKELEAHVQELEGKTEKCKDGDGEKVKQGKTVERKKDDGIVREIRETKVQESSEKKDQEPEENIEELQRKESSNHEVKLVTEDDSLSKGQEILEKDSSNVSSKRRPVEQEKNQQLKEVEKREDEEKADVETKANDGKSIKLEVLELDESEENEELNEIRKPVEEKENAPKNENEKEGNEKTAEEEMQDKVDRRIKDQEIQEPYELLENTELDKIPKPFVEGTKYHKEEEKGVADRESEEKKRVAEDVSSRRVEKIKAQETDGLEKHRKLSEIQENQSVGEKTQEHGEEEMNEGGGYKTVLETESMEDSSQSEVVEEKGSEQPERDAEQEAVAEEEREEEYNKREGEQKAKIILQVESKDSSKKNETERLRRQKKKEDRQELVEIETSDQMKGEREEKIVEKKDEYDSSSKIHEHEEGKSDKLERHGEAEEMSGSLAKEETRNDKEENRAGAEKKIRGVGFEEKKEELAIVVRHREQDKKKSFVEKDTSGKAKENKNQETKSRDDSSRKTQENEKQESHEQKKNYEEQDKKNLGQNYCGNEDDGKEVKEIAEADVPRKSKGIEKRESSEIVERHEQRDNIKELVEEKMNNQEGENKKSMITEVLGKAEDHESEGPEGLRKEDTSRELEEQRLRDNLKDEETAKTETKSKDNESRNIHQIREKETGEAERRKEQGRIKELVEDRTHYCSEKQNRENEFEDGNSKKIPEIEKEESTEPGRDEKRDEFQEPVDRETSEDDEEELEVEYEDSEEDWEAEIIQEMDSDEDNDKIRQMKRIKLGFRLVGGSAFFMSLIVIVIRFVRSKRNIRCYKF